MNSENKDIILEEKPIESKADKIKNIVIVSVLAVFMFGFCLLALFLPKPEFLDSERREPAKFPELTLESIMKDGVEYDKSFMKNFDDKYAPDNFPFREMFRSIKGFVVNYVFNHKDKDGIFMEDGYIGEMQETINKDSIDHAANKFQAIYDKYLKEIGKKPYFSIIPDKAYFLAEQNGYLSMDYDEFVKLMTDKTEFAKYLDIMGELKLQSFYKTDTHWRQEELLGVTKLLLEGMGGKYVGNYTTNVLDFPFYGVYSARVGRPVQPETIKYLTADWMNDVIVNDWESGRPRPMSLYDMNKAVGKDPYDMFLSGEKSLVTIENPNATSDKELVIFRDSFGRSIIPLLAEGYSKITILDIRYATADVLIQAGSVDFENADVLFMYSTLVLNNSSEIK